MDAGYSSDPTTSSVRTRDGDDNEEDVHSQRREQLPSFSSLHASIVGKSLLQSTPSRLGVGTGKLGSLHRVRVQRGKGSPGWVVPSIESLTGTGTDTSISEASGNGRDREENEEDADADAVGTVLGGRIPARPGSAMKEYWNSLMLDEAEGNDRLSAHLLHPARHAPSTVSTAASSTLVDSEEQQQGQQYSQNRQQKATLVAHAHIRPVSEPSASGGAASAQAILPADAAATYEHDQTRRNSPLQDHISRFVSASSSASPIHDTNTSAFSRSQLRSSTPRAPPAPAATDIANRVHDIFARHIHSASTSRSFARATEGNVSRGQGQRQSVPPRQRLRDLLGEPDGSQSGASTSSHVQHSYRPSSHVSPGRKQRQSPRQRSKSRQLEQSHAHPSDSEAMSPPRVRRQQPPQSDISSDDGLAERSYPAPAAAADRSARRTSQTPRQYPHNQLRRLDRSSSATPTVKQVQPHAQIKPAQASRLGREWESIRAQETRERCEVSHGTESLAADDEQASQDELESEENGSRGESQYQLQQEREERAAEESEGYEEVEGGSSMHRRRGEASETGAEEPNPAEYATEEEDFRISTDEEEKIPLDDGASDEEPEEASIYLVERRASPRLGSVSSFRRSTSLDASAVASSSALHSTPSKNRRTPAAREPHTPLLGPSSSRITSSPNPPRSSIKTSVATPHPSRYDASLMTTTTKTPHPPGFYAPTPDRLHVNELRSQRSRLLSSGGAGDATQLDTTFHVPGHYLSPFPHPKRLQSPTIRSGRPDVVEEDESHRVTSTPSKASRVLPKRSPSGARTTPQATPVKSSSRKASPMKPATSPSPSSRKREEPSLVSPLRKISKEDTLRCSPPADTTASHNERLSLEDDEANTTITHMFNELVKPIRGLLTGFTSPLKSSVSSSTTLVDSPTKSRSAKTDSELSAKRRLEQDHILASLTEADRLDRTLSARIDEMRRAVDEMGQKLTAQVTSVLHDSFQKESRKRKLWYSAMILSELLLLWVIFSYANTRASFIQQSTSVDPFLPQRALHHHQSYRLASQSDIPQLSSLPFSPAVNTLLSNFLRSLAMFDAIAQESSWFPVYLFLKQFFRHLVGLGSYNSDFLVHGTYGAPAFFLSSVNNDQVASIPYRVPT